MLYQEVLLALGMKLILAYLIIGCLFGLAVELAWPYFADESDGEIQNAHRLFAVVLWPVVILIALENLMNDNENGDDNDNQSDNGVQSGWSY